MQDNYPNLNPADFADHVVIDLTANTISHKTIKDAIASKVTHGVGHVIVNTRDDGTVTWTPIYRASFPGDPGQPKRFPEVLAGYGSTIEESFVNLRYLFSMKWACGNSTSRLALVFEDADDAAAFERAIKEVGA